MQYKDYYKILGLDRSAGQSEIKRAYQKLARKYHPDVSKESSAESRFKEINEAYHALKDPEKRKAYDELGNQWHQGQEFKPPPGWEFHFSRQKFSPEEGDLGGFSDFFATLFGDDGPLHEFQGRQRELRLRGQDLHTTIEITLEEAFSGTHKSISLETQVRDPQGQLQPRRRQLSVRIPSGILEGQRIRLAGQGGPGIGGGAAGDLYLQIQFTHHRHFQAQGRDIYLELPVTPWEAALGTQLMIPTLAGPVRMNIPAGSQTGTKLRLNGRGLPAKTGGDGQAGNQYVLLRIETPPADTEAARQLYQQMASTFAFDPRKSRGL